MRLIRKHRQRRQVCCHLLVKYKITFCTDVLSTVVNSADGPNFIIFMPSVDGWWKFKQGTAIVPCAWTMDMPTVQTGKHNLSTPYFVKRGVLHSQFC